METVNEVLSNLFPNGFTDIFRFSYASEQPTPAADIPIPDVEERPKPTSVPSPETKITPAPSSTTTTTTTEKPRESRGKAFFSYETSISKEYRRELRPGHTEIVVEKLELLPRSTSTGSGEFSDGSNLITKDELLRINRAAADSPVLPSLLMNPSEGNSTVTAASPAGKQAPIIILNDDDSADMEGISAEDNLIAESQNIGQRVYQLLPVGDKPYSDKFSVQKQQLRPGSELNQRPIFVPEEQQPEEEPSGDKAEAPKAALSNQQLDTFQEHAEQSFRQLNLVQEAPSRKFLRNFNPVLSTGASTLTPKGVFHYEANALQPNYYVQAGKSGELATKQGLESGRGSGKVQSAAPAEQQYDKDAAQLRYFKEQQYLQQQQQLLQQQQQLLLQQQQQEQQRQQHEMLVQQQQQLQRQEKMQQQQQQQYHQQQQQRQEEDRRGQQLFQPSSQKPQQQQQQQQQLQQFHKELKSQQQYVSHHQQPPLQQHYAIFQQHPPPHEYKQTQQGQQQNQYVMQQQQHQKEEEEKARKQQQEQQKQREEQFRKQQQQAQHENQQQQEHQALQHQQAQHEKQQQQPLQLQQSTQSQQQQHTNQPSPLKPVSKLHTKIVSDSEPASASLDHQTYQHPLESAITYSEPATPTPHSVVFVTLNTPSSQASRAHSTRPAFAQKSPYEYVSEAAGAASQHAPSAPPTPAAIVKRPQGGYTFVEVQKSVNIHNKLITEKDGKLVEEHETFYPQQQYAIYQQQTAKAQPPAPPSSAQTPPPSPQHKSPGQAPKPATAPESPYVEVPYTHYPLQYAQQLSLLEEGVHPNDYYFVPREYASLSANPINVQHIDEPEEQEEASSYTHIEQALPLHDQVVPQPHAQAQVGQEQAHPQQYVQYTQHYAQQPVEQHAPQHEHQPIQQPPQQAHGEHHHQPVAEKEIVEKVVEHQVEKIVERPVHIPYPVHVQQFIDRPYPVQEIVETHIPVPYPVPEPVPVPVHVDRYIERPYPVEKIVEKRVPYPVEKVVEKIVEKEIPVEVEKVVEKVVDRPVPIPIRVPVAVPVPYAQQSLPDYNENADIFDPPFYSHPNALGWPEPTGAIDFSGRSPVGQQIPPKVLQNYYTRMLKKLLPQVQAQRGTAPTTTTATTVYTHTQARLKTPSTGTTKPFKSTKSQKSVAGSVTTPKQHSFKIGDIRFDLKPPPPPPTGPEWTKGSRYIYNTLPHDLSVADTSDSDQLTDAYSVPFPSHNEPYDEFQRWRNGHSLKRSPQFGRNLQMEYGFKPPLVPSVEINDQGIPLNADAKKAD
ncbi:probable serine/threonine-protein kinase kinX [Anastrepha ludens]|uniref:probable serine/threonine-protein kinase kinX n=1 Tax=Anastrepha ludens TaxID=28586 RepID=UPI0023B08EBD|nr:probable serine/threonine-protein kinase kinX [Anastrepha ludens]